VQLATTILGYYYVAAFNNACLIRIVIRKPTSLVSLEERSAKSVRESSLLVFVATFG